MPQRPHLMKLKDFLRENIEKHSVLALAKMNPVTIHHTPLVNTVKNVAKRYNADHLISLNHSQDSEENPISPQRKLKYARTSFPDTNFRLTDNNNPSIVHQASALHDQGTTHLHVVTSDDNLDDYSNLLNKYQGSLYSFKKIKFHSFGESDPDSETAASVRAHAATGDFDTFVKHIPENITYRDVYNDIRKGMSINESTENQLVEQYLMEGVHDHGIFKSVFLVGSPNSGKDHVLKKTLSDHGLTEINSDKAHEYLTNLSKKIPETEEEKQNFLKQKAKNPTELKHYLALMGRNGVIINGSSHEIDRHRKIKNNLEKLGYDTSMVLVHTSDDVSQQRNIARGQAGGRAIPEIERQRRWNKSNNARSNYSNLFKGNYTEFDNSEDFRSADPDTVQAKQNEMNDIHKNISKFVSTAPKNEVAKEWVVNQMYQNKPEYASVKKSDKAPNPGTRSTEAAAKAGLQYYGKGKFGNKNKVTHTSIHGKLVDIKKYEKEPESKKLNESYEYSDTSAFNALTLGMTPIVYNTPNESTDTTWGNLRITMAEIRKRAVQRESIDMGIEPGVSMAGSGESVSRDTGEKIKKKTGKATQVTETIGDGGEMASSMSDQKENELKRQGLDLRSFKGKILTKKGNLS